MAVVVALDVGGTTIKCALVRPDGTVAHTQRHPTGASRGPQAVVERILDVASGLATAAAEMGEQPVAAGIVVPGVVDVDAGIAVWSANLGFRDVPLVDLLERRLGMPSTLGHDVRAAGLAEARLGAGRGHRHVLVLPIGTGIAAASIVDGQILNGAHGAAGEVGHIIVRPGGERCGCGAAGCLETIASATAIARRYRDVAGESIPAEEVVARAASREPRAMVVWDEAVAALADGLLTLIALFDPAAVVIGGGLAEAGDALLAPLRDALRARLTFHREPVLCGAALGDQAGCLGAALLALDHRSAAMLASRTRPAGSGA